MVDPKFYREACRELKAPEDKIEEVIAMTENTNKKKRRPLRTALIAVAAVAMMVVGVSAANPEGVQTLWRGLKNVIQVDQYRMDMTTSSGQTVTGITVPPVRLENQDDRAVLMIGGKTPVDITDELAQDQYYVYEDIAEGSKIVVTVEGTIDQWNIETAVYKLEEDGTYKWFGSERVNNETVDNALHGTIVDHYGIFGEVYEDVDLFNENSTDVQVTITYAEVND